MKIGYTKTFEMKILRVKHLVVFNMNTRKIDLVNMLNDVPDDAVVDEVIEDNEGFSSIEFHEEKKI